mgnify:FL=1
MFSSKMSDLGLSCSDVSETEIYDFMVEGCRVEVKTASLSKDGSWTFDFTRNKGNFDVLAACGIYEGSPYWMIVPAEELATIVSIGTTPFSKFKSWARWSTFINRWDLLSNKKVV